MNRLALLVLLALASCPGDPQPELPAGALRHDARFGPARLCGYTIEPRRLTLRAGEEVRLTLWWQLDAPLSEGWRPFTHLHDERGRMIANLDDASPLRAEPPSRWPAGELVRDELAFTVPPAADGRLSVAVGFFQGAERLGVSGKGSDERAAAALIPLRAEAGRLPPVPELAVPRLAAGAAIAIDGKLDELAWQRAAATGAFVDPTTGAPDRRSPVQASARLLWDDAALYLAVEVEDETVEGGFPPDAIDPHLWLRDAVELMIDPDGDGRDYYEIQLGPQNLVFDSLFDDYNQPRGADGPFGHEPWSARLESAVAIDGTLDDARDVDRGWLVELRLPWASFVRGVKPPRPGERWRLNLYAIERNDGVAWSPILGQGNFHRASRFGRVVWSERAVP